MDFSALPPGTRIVDGNLIVPAGAGQFTIRVKETNGEDSSAAISVLVPPVGAPASPGVPAAPIVPAAPGTPVPIATSTAGNDLPDKITAGEALPSFTAVALIDWVGYRYDPTNRAHAYAYGGFTESSVLQGAHCTLRQTGVLTFPQGTLLTMGARYLAGPEGGIASAPAAGDKFTRIFGVAMSPTELILATQNPIFLL